MSSPTRSTSSSFATAMAAGGANIVMGFTIVVDITTVIIVGAVVVVVGVVVVAVVVVVIVVLLWAHIEFCSQHPYEFLRHRHETPGSRFSINDGKINFQFFAS
jgi:hypothetical protein